MLQARAYPSESQALAYPSLNEAMAAWITFESNGGSPVTPQEVTPGGLVTPVTPTRASFTFSGWFLDTDFTVPWIFTDPVASVDGFTLYAKWTSNDYVITWYLNGGVDPGNPATYTVLDAITFLPATRAGYGFNGWYADSQFQTPPVTGIPAGTTGDRQYYAKWGAEVYPITYHLDGGINNGENPGGYTRDGSTVYLLPPAKPGYVFHGWFADSGFTLPVETIPSGSTGPVEVWAKWEMEVYAIFYIVNGGENDPRNPREYTVHDDVPLYPPDRDGFEFAGWFDNDRYAGSAINRLPPGSTGTKRLYARWAKADDVSADRKESDRYSGDPKLFDIGGR